MTCRECGGAGAVRTLVHGSEAAHAPGCDGGYRCSTTCPVEVETIDESHDPCALCGGTGEVQ